MHGNIKYYVYINIMLTSRVYMYNVYIQHHKMQCYAILVYYIALVHQYIVSFTIYYAQYILL